MLQVRVLDDVLKLAKLRSNDPKKYLPLAVNMLKDRLQQNDKKRLRKQSVRFVHTLETLFMATNDEPEIIAKLLKKTFEKNSKEYLMNDQDSSEKIIEDVDKKIDSSLSLTEPISDMNILSYPKQMSTIDKYRQTLPVIDEGVESTTSISNTRKKRVMNFIRTF